VPYRYGTDARTIRVLNHCEPGGGTDMNAEERASHLRACVLACVILPITAGVSVLAAPFVPASDTEVLERFAVSPSNPALCELRALQGQLRRMPDNLPLAVQVAQGYLELGPSRVIRVTPATAKQR